MRIIDVKLPQYMEEHITDCWGFFGNEPRFIAWRDQPLFYGAVYDTSGTLGDQSHYPLFQVELEFGGANYVELLPQVIRQRWPDKGQLVNLPKGWHLAATEIRKLPRVVF